MNSYQAETLKLTFIKYTLKKVLNMNITQKICLSLFVALCAIATYATEDGVPKCDTIFGQHLDRSQGQCI